MSTEGQTLSRFYPTLQVLDMLLSAVSVLVVAQRISEVPKGLNELPCISVLFICDFSMTCSNVVFELLQVPTFGLRQRYATTI
jgi:hypothetical protein